MGEVTYHCEGKPSEKAGLDSELNLREEVRRIQLETLRPSFVSVIRIILPVVLTVVIVVE